MIVSVTRAVPILFFLKKKISEDRPLRTSKIALPANSPIRYTLPDRHPRPCDLSSSDNHTLFTMSKIEEPSGFHRRRSPYPSQLFETGSKPHAR